MKYSFPKVCSKKPVDNIKMYNPYWVVVVVMVEMPIGAGAEIAIWVKSCFIIMNRRRS